MGEFRQVSRQQLSVHRRCPLGHLSFASLETSDHVVRIVDISKHGVGVETDVQMEPGLVWFRNGLEDHRGGILLWSRKQNEQQHRAGIRFLSLTTEDERLLRNWPPCPEPLRPCIDLEEFISLWMRGSRERA